MELREKGPLYSRPSLLLLFSLSNRWPKVWVIVCSLDELQSSQRQAGVTEFTIVYYFSLGIVIRLLYEGNELLWNSIGSSRVFCDQHYRRPFRNLWKWCKVKWCTRGTALLWFLRLRCGQCKTYSLQSPFVGPLRSHQAHLLVFAGWFDWAGFFLELIAW